MKRVLIANRGEIALRIIRTCKKLGLETVAVHSPADSRSPVLAEADEVCLLDGETPAATYLNIDAILRAATFSGADALHPGYGFLAESPELAEAVRRANIVFVGPSPEVMRLAGNKDTARKIAAANGIPVPRGYDGVSQDPEVLLSAANEIGYPLLVKAVAGGGGRGMRLVSCQGELEESIDRASKEAKAFFGDGRLILEQYISPARHIEVQLFGDAHGSVIHLFERECSLQRRYQKVIEESPARNLSPTLRERLLECATGLGRAVALEGAATVEFLVSEHANDDGFAFLEVNPRIQVEHPVTEQVTGLDIVELQLRVASGERIGISQEEVSVTGCAVEARVCAEVPAQEFRPSAGTITTAILPEAEGIRLEHALAAGVDISPQYDSLILKVIAHATTHAEAASMLERALGDVVLGGLDTNLWFLRRVLRSHEYLDGTPDTGFLDRTLATLAEPDTAEQQRMLRAAAASHLSTLFPQTGVSGQAFFRNAGHAETPLIRLEIECGALGAKLSCAVRLKSVHTGKPSAFRIEVDGAELLVQPTASKGELILSQNGTTLRVRPLSLRGADRWYASSEQYIENTSFRVTRPRGWVKAQGPGAQHELRAPLPGKVVALSVEAGDWVERGDPLVVIESMKMEHTLSAAGDAVIAELRVENGAAVKEGELLILFAPEKSAGDG